jgi:predicted restriction endonuclease
MPTWREATWAAIQRQASSGAAVTRTALIANELPTIKAEVGSTGATPEQTLSRVLQELRDEGVLIFDGQGQYRIAEGVADESVEVAVATEQWKLQKTRIGQGPFRSALLARWQGRCPLTGIAEPELLRASHIIPWNRCESDAERVNPENGLLLSALWDAAFDRGLVSFADDGRVLPLAGLSGSSFAVLAAGRAPVLRDLSPGNRERLRWHRGEYGAG